MTMMKTTKTTDTLTHALDHFKHWLLDTIGEADADYHEARANMQRFDSVHMALRKKRLDTLHEVEQALLDAGLVTVWRAEPGDTRPWVKYPYTVDVSAHIGVQCWLDDHVGKGPYEWKTENGETWVCRKVEPKQEVL